MATTLVSPTPGVEAPRKLSLIDCDVHQAAPSNADIAAYLPDFWKKRGLASSGGHPWGNPFGVNRADAAPPNGGSPASAPQFLGEHLLDAFGIDYAVLTGNVVGLGVNPNADHATATARAYNDWLIDHWLDQDARFLGSVMIAPQDPLQAAQEIRRVACSTSTANITRFVTFARINMSHCVKA